MAHRAALETRKRAFSLRRKQVLELCLSALVNYRFALSRRISSLGPVLHRQQKKAFTNTLLEKNNDFGEA